MQLAWSKNVIEDLDNIWEYIAADNITRAFSFIDELRSDYIINYYFKICHLQNKQVAFCGNKGLYYEVSYCHFNT